MSIHSVPEKISLNTLVHASRYLVFKELRCIYQGLMKVNNVTRVSFDDIQKNFCPYIQVGDVKEAFLAMAFFPKQEEGVITIDEQKVTAFFADKSRKYRIPHTVRWESHPELVYAAWLARQHSKGHSFSPENLKSLNYLFALVEPTGFYSVKSPFVRTGSQIELSDQKKKEVEQRYFQIFQS